jgi:hypothetical protein
MQIISPKDTEKSHVGAKFGSEVVKDSVDAVLENGFTEQ